VDGATALVVQTTRPANTTSGSTATVPKLREAPCRIILGEDQLSAMMKQA
jgi:hypothetical protein